MSDIPPVDSFDTITVDANDITFTCVHAGMGDKLALCLHGFPDDAGTMGPLLSTLASHNYTAVAPYMRGYGPTGAAPDTAYGGEVLGMDALALEAELRKEFSTTKSVLIGHDWGASAAYSAAAIEPTRFDKMVTLAVPPGFGALMTEYPEQFFRSWYMWFFQLDEVPEQTLQWNNHAFIELLWDIWSPGWDYPEHRISEVKSTFATGETVKNALAYYRESVGNLIYGLMNGSLPDRNQVEPIKTPILVLHGESDGCIGANLTAAAEDFIETGMVKTVPDAGHFLHLEQPAGVNEAIISFLEE